jgi:hypothetical protein
VNTNALARLDRSHALAPLDRAVKALAGCRDLSEVKRIRSLAEAAAKYAQAEKLGAEAVGYAQEIIFKASRRAGELLAEMTETAKGASGPGRGKAGAAAGPAFNDAPRLSDLGITKKESSRWQAIAKIPEPVFEKLLRGENPPRSEEALARAGRKPRVYEPAFDPESVRRRGAFARVCSELVALGDPAKTAAEFKRGEFKKYGMDDLLLSARSAAEWLVPFIDEWTKEGAA